MLETIKLLIQDVQDPLYRKIFEALIGELEATRRWEERFDRLEAILDELIKAQRNFQLALEGVQEEIEALKEAVRETQREIEALKEAQKETNRSIDALREEFRKEKEDIWKILTKLTENLEKLHKDHRVTREQLGGLAHAVGYLLEDRAFVGLPRLLAEEGFEVEEPFRREYLQIGHERWLEVNIYGVIRRNGERFYVIGEAKTQLKKRDVDQFLRHLKEVERWLPGRRLFPLLVTYQTSPQVREYVRKKGLRLYFSYQFPLVSGPF